MNAVSLLRAMTGFLLFLCSSFRVAVQNNFPLLFKLRHTNHFFSSLIRPEAQPNNSLLVLNVPWSEHQPFVTSFPSRTHSVKTFKSKFLSFVGNLEKFFLSC